jgi:tripartite-type tricarboxylate transporter receptor subunit TctC
VGVDVVRARNSRVLKIGAAAATVLVVAACGGNGGEDSPAASGSSGAEACDFSYEGETITAIINYSAGGPTDTFGRLFVEHLSGNLPGEPNIVVENAPGAEGILGSNKVYEAEPDGMTIGILTAPGLPDVLDNPAVTFDMAGWTWLAGIPETEVFFIRSDAGVEEAAGLVDAANEVVIGGYGPTDVVDLSARSMLNALGADYRYVTGYPGGNDALAAFSRNEINAFIISLSSFIPRVQPMIEAGDAVALAQIGLLDDKGEVVRDERVGDIPTVLEVLEEEGGLSEEQEQALRLLSADLSVLRAIVAPPGLDECTAEALRTGMDETFSSSEFKQAALDLLGFEVAHMDADAALTVAEDLVDTDGAPEGKAYLQELAGDEDARG